MNALALRPARIPARRNGSATALQTPVGGVSAIFALEGFDRRRGVATYSLRVMNYSRSQLVCRTWIISRAGDAAPAHPMLLEVAPRSTAATQIPVWPGDFASFDRAIAEVAGDGVHCLVEAPAPRISKLHRAYTFAAASLVAGILAIVTAGALRSAVPRIAAFAVPPEALAGTTVRAEYGAEGAGNLSYYVQAPDGSRIAGGTLSQMSGSIPIAIPASDQPGAYTLQMTMAGPLGTTSETRVLNTLVMRPHSKAQIAAISVNPVVARPGETVEVAYSAAGDEGYVRLMGTDGTIWGQQPFSRTGQTHFVVPPFANPGELRVLLHVTKGNSTAQSMAGIVVAAAHAPAAAPAAAAPAILSDDDPASAATMSSDANGTFELAAKTVRSGGSIAVKIISPRNGMRIALVDLQSHEVQGVDVGASDDVVTLHAPTVQAATRYVVQASFTDGFGQESVVAPVTVVP
ncbi:MAG TPA: hypothetical protein VMU38_03050 [Candidatus Binatia bacterium]|nr:hypothetical protein [Candidatus Binatia bacterium]